MKKILLSVGYFFILASLYAQDAVYVSPTGNDTYTGLSVGNPVATVSKALEIVKDKGIKQLNLLGGVYRIEQPIVLTPEFSGLKISGPGTISGGKPITGWKPYKKGIWQAIIPAAKDGIRSFRQIYVNGELRYRARTPNEGFFRVAGCPDGTPKTTGYQTHSQSFEFAPGDIRSDWKNLNDVEAVVYFFWLDNHLPIESVDKVKNTVKFKYKSSKTFTDGFSEDGARYFIENTFEALDEPGEWYLDKPKGILYYMPKEGEDMTKAEVIAPFAKELLRIEGDPANGKFTEDVELANVVFEHCNFDFPPGSVNNTQGSAEVSAAVNLINSKNCRFNSCSFTNLGTFAVDIKDGCSDNRVSNCLFHNLSAGAVRVNGGKAGSSPLTHTKNNLIMNNEISGYGMNYLSAVGILIQNSYGNRIIQNHIHNGFYTGISVGWIWGYGRSISRDNVIERNHIHHIGQGVLSDMGAIYTLGPAPGIVIRNNLIHDIDAYKYGGWGIYNDEGSTGILVEKNIVYNTKYAGYDMHYGKEITIRNNIFALGRIDQIRRQTGENHPSLYFENNIVYWKEGKLFEGDWKDRVYNYDSNPKQLQGVEYKRNFESNWNVFYNPNLKIDEVKFDGGSFSDWQKRGYDVNSIYSDPMFVDTDNFDFRLKPESPALKNGFEQIKLDGIPGVSITNKR